MDKVIADLIERTKRQKELISNTDYIDWLYEFTKKHEVFSTMSCSTVNPKNISDISDEDMLRMDLLTDFFTAISDYCAKNMLDPQGPSTDFLYSIKYKDIQLDIGVCIGQGAYNFVTRKNEVAEDAVDFANIMNDVKDNNLDVKLEKLSQIEKLLDEMKSLGMSYDHVIRIMKQKGWK